MSVLEDLETLKQVEVVGVNTAGSPKSEYKATSFVQAQQTPPSVYRSTKSKDILLKRITSSGSENSPALSMQGSGHIYIVGGIGEASKLSTILKYNISTNKWQDTQIILQLNRGGVFLDRENNFLSTFGGRKDSSLISKVYNLDLAEDELSIEDTPLIKIKRSGFGFI